MICRNLLPLSAVVKCRLGADGLILIEPSDKADFSWRFYNSDGSRAEMCGNGARCAARFAYVNGIAGENLTFETDAGIVCGQVYADRAKVKMPDPTDLRLDYSIELTNGPPDSEQYQCRCAARGHHAGCY